jgi:uroporphyrinogen-III synthase
VSAENSLDSIRKLINQAKDFSIPVYRNVPVREIPDAQFDILIFTSPMNTDIWFDNRTYQGEKIISIGPTTADHLKTTHKIENIVVAENPSEASLAECLRKLL